MNATASTNKNNDNVYIKNRISHRSISKHTQPQILNLISKDNSTKANVKSNGDNRSFNILKNILNPDWEVDYLNELSVEKEDEDEDKTAESKSEKNMDLIFDELKTNQVNSLQELRFLNSINPNFENLDLANLNDNLVHFNELIMDSKKLLNPLFNYLIAFEKNLKNLSNEMESLQKRSNFLNVEILNKKKIDEKLTPILNDLILSPILINSILNDEINTDWIENLNIVNEKKELYEKYSSLDPQEFKFLPELIQLLDDLELKLVERIRNFLVIQIKNLRKDKVSSQLIQKNLLNLKEIYDFLSTKNPKLAKELKTAYIYTIRYYYYQNFIKYLYSIEQLQFHKLDDKILLGSNDDEMNKKSFFTNYNSSDSISINEYLINLPKRLEILNKKNKNDHDNGNNTVMLAQIAETNNLKFWIEVGFKNFNQAFLDNFSLEYNFLTEFFKISNDNNEINDVIKLIFNPIYQLGYNYTKFLINTSFDLFGILIMIRLCQNMEYEIQHRCIPIFENYLNFQLILLWPKFQKLIDLNCNSLNKLISSSAIIKWIKSNSNNYLIPLKLTQNFGLILINLIKLSMNLVFEIETSEPLTNSIVRLSNNFELTIMKLSENIHSENFKKLFLFNNFSLVLTILQNELSQEEIFKNEKNIAQFEKNHYKNLVVLYDS